MKPLQGREVLRGREERVPPLLAACVPAVKEFCSLGICDYMRGMVTTHQFIEGTVKFVRKVTCPLKREDMLALFVVGIRGQRYVHMLRECPC